MQAFLLFENFAIYSCDDNLFFIAQNIHRNLVDAARECRLLQDDNGTEDPEDVETTNGLSNPFREPESIEKQWKDFIEHESRKR